VRRRIEEEEEEMDRDLIITAKKQPLIIMS